MSYSLHRSATRTHAHARIHPHSSAHGVYEELEEPGCAVVAGFDVSLEKVLAQLGHHVVEGSSVVVKPHLQLREAGDEEP